MKKRKELDALVPNGKVKKKCGGSGSGAELLRVDSETTDTEEFSVLQPKKFSSQKVQGCLSSVRAACLPMCTVTLFAACLVGSGTLIWMQFGMRQEVDLLREHVRQVEESAKVMPSEFHTIHSQLNELQKNHSALKEEVDQLNKTLDSITKEIATLKKTSAEIQKSVADAPQLESLPKDFKSLSESLAAMGSKITDLETGLNKNVDTVKEFVANTDKDKIHLQELYSDMQKKIEHLSVSQDKTTETTSVYTYIDSELKKLEESLYETNSSIWEKMLSMNSDNFPDHNLLENLRTNLQNLSERVAKLESFNATEISQRLKLNETIKEAINALFPNSSYVGNLSINGTVSLASLVEYIKTLTRVYVALMIDSKLIPSSVMASINETFDMNINRSIQAAIEGAWQQQNNKIQELHQSVEQLKGAVEQMKPGQSSNVTAISEQQLQPQQPQPQQQQGDKSSSPATMVTQAQQQLKAPGETPVTESGLTSNVTTSTTTVSPSNATVIHKPSQTGQSLNKPELRPDSPPPD